MKLFFTCTFFILVTSVFSQTIFKTSISTPSLNDLNTIDKIIQLADGSYIGVGTKAGDSSAVSVIKLDAKGTLITSKIIYDSIGRSRNSGFSVIKTLDNGIVICGSIGFKMALMKFDVNLTLQWKKQYAIPGKFSSSNQVIQTTDGNYIIVGGTYDTPNINAASYLVKTDSNGNVLFSKQFFLHRTSAIDDIFATNDGNYMLLVQNTDGDIYKWKTAILKVTRDGNVLWTKYINTGDVGNIPTAFLQTSDGSIVTSGFLEVPVTINTSGNSFNVPYPRILICKFNASGTLNWSKIVNSSGQSNSVSNSVIEDKDGGYIFTGHYNKFDSTLSPTINSAYLIKLASDGALEWTKTVNDSLSSYSSIAHTSDGGIITTGFSYQSEGRNLIRRRFICKFNNNFDICGSTSSIGDISDLGTDSAASTIDSLVTTVVNDVSIVVNEEGTGTNLCSVLPLQLLSFNAILENKSVNLEWKTANEVNTDYFTVERSSNIISFAPLRKVNAKGTNSNVQTYTTNDLHPLFGTSYYRLKEIDKDGKITYSSIIPITFTAQGSLIISPNPVHNNIRILFQSKSFSSSTFQITDMAGRTLATQDVKVNIGMNTIILPAASLNKGLYILRVIENNIVQSVKFIKQ